LQSFIWQNENGIACILGTGSNACLYRGGKIEKEAVSFGYILGDEGSGSHLGKLLLKGIFSNNAPAEISQAFHREFPIIELSYILEHLYRLPSPNKFLARFAPFIYKHRQHAYIKSMLEFAFDDFLNEFVIKIAEENDDRIGFLGSIAYFFEEEIKQACIKKACIPQYF
jgi:glucosamine kinase